MATDRKRSHALAEQARVDKTARELWVARVRHVAATNPDLPLTLLAERFNCTRAQILAITSDLKIDRSEGIRAWLAQQREKEINDAGNIFRGAHPNARPQRTRSPNGAPPPRPARAVGGRR